MTPGTERIMPDPGDLDLTLRYDPMHVRQPHLRWRHGVEVAVGALCVASMLALAFYPLWWPLLKGWR